MVDDETKKNFIFFREKLLLQYYNIIFVLDLLFYTIYEYAKSEQFHKYSNITKTSLIVDKCRSTR
jgi:hypothetical protein